MWGLILSTVLTSAADSLNPIAIAQQFVLQGLVKKPGHIWYFILPTGITNLIGGYLAYYGLASLIADFFKMLMARHGVILFSVELLLGVILLLGVVRALLKKGESERDEKGVANVKSVSPAALIALGVGAAISELVTALPYFAFLAILFSYRLSFPVVSLVLVVYNIIYMLPLMIMYWIYVTARDRFDQLYRIIKAQVTKWSGALLPAVTSLIGGFLVWHAATGLLG